MEKIVLKVELFGKHCVVNGVGITTSDNLTQIIYPEPCSAKNLI